LRVSSETREQGRVELSRSWAGLDLASAKAAQGHVDIEVGRCRDRGHKTRFNRERGSEPYFYDIHVATDLPLARRLSTSADPYKPHHIKFP
jgi:hypothetical protein